MKRSVFILLVLLSAAVAQAAPVGKDAAMAKAKEFIRSRQGQQKAARVRPARVQDVQLKAAEEESLYFVFNVGDGDGFVVVGGDDRVSSVLGYADQGAFDPERVPDNMRAWLQGYADQIEWLRQHDGAEASTAASLAKAPTKNAVSPLMASRWNQSAPYNNGCPMFINGSDRCVTGCVATAMAQVMYYHAYPASTTAEIPAYQCSTNWSGYGRISVGAVAAGTVLDWDNMLPSYGSGTGTAQNEAVAVLMAACGASVEMDYRNASNGGSGAVLTLTATALTTYFGYSATTRGVARSAYSMTEWNNLIYDELRAGRPVLYGGSSSGGGHAFVVDGYDGDELFHVNWGWGGYCDGYFLLSVLNPGSTEGIGASTSSDGYSFDQDAVIGIKPQDGEQGDDSGVMMTCKLLSVSGNTVYGRYENKTGQTYSFDFGIGYLDADGTLKAISTTSTFDLPTNKLFPSVNFSVGNLPDGTYRVVPISRVRGTQEWLTSVDTDAEYVEVVVANGGKTLTLHLPSDGLVATEISFPGSHVVNSAQPVSVAIKNNGAEFYGPLYLFASQDSNKGSKKSTSGVTIQSGKEQATQFEFTPNVTGEWNVWIAADEAGSRVIGEATVEIWDSGGGELNLEAVGTVLDKAENGKIYGTSVRGRATIRNNDGSPFIGSLRVWLLRNTEGNKYSGIKYVDVPTSIASGETAEVEYELSDLTIGERYMIQYYYASTNSKINNERVGVYVCTAAIETYLADGTRKLVEMQPDLQVDSEVAAVVLTGISGVNSVAGGNPNTLYFLDAGANAPTGAANVVKGSTAEEIVLADGYDFYSPLTFTAQRISYTRTFTGGLTRDYKGWTTITLPFDVKDDAAEGVKVDLDGTLYPIDWFHSADETRKNFWVMEFGSENDAVVNFTHAERLVGGRPFIIAVPGAEWGNANDLTGLPITFCGENATITSDFRAATSGDNYKMKGVVARQDLSSVFVLNATGESFGAQATASVDAFRAYFEAASTAATARRLTIALGGGSTTGLGSIYGEPSSGGVTDGAWYTLSGSRIAKGQLQKGIYIHNGRKVVVK